LGGVVSYWLVIRWEIVAEVVGDYELRSNQSPRIKHPHAVNTEIINLNLYIEARNGISTSNGSILSFLFLEERIHNNIREVPTIIKDIPNSFLYIYVIVHHIQLSAT